MKSDLQTEDDVHTVVRAFYGAIESDPMLGHFFAGLDWNAHLPRMVAFWSSIVFGTGAYRGRPFDPHARMQGLGRAHFAHWLDQFRLAVDAHFEGENAEQMKARAAQITSVFQVKLGLWPDDDAA